MLRSSFDSSSVKEDTGLLESAAEHEKEPDAKVDHKRSLDWIALAALLFFNVSGGPIGTEGLVAAVGPFYSGVDDSRVVHHGFKRRGIRSLGRHGVWKICGIHDGVVCARPDPTCASLPYVARSSLQWAMTRSTSMRKQPRMA
eukprot:1862297-Rhodomonas_salina.1